MFYKHVDYSRILLDINVLISNFVWCCFGPVTASCTVNTYTNIFVECLWIQRLESYSKMEIF